MLKLEPQFTSICEGKVSTDKISTLFVGEGNFSFAASYIQNLVNSKCREFVVATSLNTECSIVEENYNIEIIKKNGGCVFTDVDATKLEYHPAIGKCLFSKIFFHFPHVPQKMNIEEDRKLVELFFKSAQRVLQVNGKIGVTLCCKQGGTGAEMMPRIYENTWKIVYLAANAHLILCDIEFFNSQLYDTYKCSGYRGLSKQFNIEGAVTHMFCRSELAPVISENHDSFKRDITEKFILDIKNLYLSLSKKVNTPFTKLAYSLDAVVKSACPSLETIFIADLLLCKSFALPITSVTDKKIINCDETYLHDKCLDVIISEFLKFKRKDDVITSIISCIFCWNYFRYNFYPFVHYLSYFCSSEESFLKCLNTILEYLKQEFPLNTPEFCWLNISTHLKGREVSFEQLEYSHYNKEFIRTIYAICTITKDDCCMFHTNIDIVICQKQTFTSSTERKIFEIGQIIRFTHFNKPYYVHVLNLEVVSVLKYHISEYKILLLNEAYFCQKKLQGKFNTVYRSISLYPPSYIHDVSFWADDHFSEPDFFMLAWNAGGGMIKSVTLIDVYHEISTNRRSRCYRFHYQSCNKVLTEENVSKTHSYLRHLIETKLKVKLR